MPSSQDQYRHRAESFEDASALRQQLHRAGFAIPRIRSQAGASHATIGLGMMCYLVRVSAQNGKVGAYERQLRLSHSLFRTSRRPNRGKIGSG
jgi:hypothetical protein